MRRWTMPSSDGTQLTCYSVGDGEPLLIVGGALTVAKDYERLAAALPPSFEVHIVERRGWGARPAIEADYSIAAECDDLLSIAHNTGAVRAFGHSYGGLVVLETALRADLFREAVVYEPAVSEDGSVPTAWMDDYAAALAEGDRRGAFTHFVRGSGHAPEFLTRLPARYVRGVLRLAIPGERWRRMEPLLEANLAEHREVAALDGPVSRYADLGTTVHILAGRRSSGASQRMALRLQQALRTATLETLHGLGHNAPLDKAQTVGAVVRRALNSQPSARR